MRTTTQDVRGEKVFDSRDAIARTEELTGWRDAAMDSEDRDLTATDETWTAEDGTVYWITPDWDEDTEREWKQLTQLAEDVGSSEWNHGLVFILDSYFEDYARQLAEDIGVLKDCDHWPANCIDWERAARELQTDYSQVELDGNTYYYRG